MVGNKHCFLAITAMSKKGGKMPYHYLSIGFWSIFLFFTGYIQPYLKYIIEEDENERRNRRHKKIS